MGLIEQRQGQGTFVRRRDTQDKNPFAAAMKAQDASLNDLLEVRMGLECNAAALAAQRAVEEDIYFLEKCLEEMRQEIKSGRLGTEADVSFHMAISYATKNPLQVFLMRTFYDFLFVSIKESLSHLYEKSGNIEKILDQHTQIVHTIRNHDPEQAYQAMKRHITFVLNFFKDLT
jgi:GntR family transcriptional repressor for pyruvate dehydrogenase complex